MQIGTTAQRSPAYVWQSPRSDIVTHSVVRLRDAPRRSAPYRGAQQDARRSEVKRISTFYISSLVSDYGPTLLRWLLKRLVRW